MSIEEQAQEIVQDNIETPAEGAENNETPSADGQQAKEEKSAMKKMLRSLKIKFNGKETDESLPFEIPDDDASREYMTKHLQMSRLSQSKSQEKADLERQVNNFIDELRKNPKKALSNPAIGIDIKKLAAEIIEEEIENSKKSPEQIKREEMEEEIRQLRESQEKKEKEFKETELTRMQKMEMDRFDREISDTLSKSDLPKSPYVVKKIVEYMSIALKGNKELGIDPVMDISPNDVMPLVREEILQDIKEMFKVMPDEVLDNFIGNDVYNRLRKKNLSKAKEKPPVPIKQAAKDVGAKKGKEAAKDTQSFKQFFGL